MTRAATWLLGRSTQLGAACIVHSYRILHMWGAASPSCSSNRLRAVASGTATGSSSSKGVCQAA
jgi:hypothetical protein